MGHSPKARIHNTTMFAIGMNISRPIAPLYPALEKILQYTTAENIIATTRKMREPIMMGASAPPFRVFVLGSMTFSFYNSSDSWSGKLFKSIAIITYTMEEFATEHGGCHLLPPL